MRRQTFLTLRFKYRGNLMHFQLDQVKSQVTAREVTHIQQPIVHYPHTHTHIHTDVFLYAEQRIKYSNLQMREEGNVRLGISWRSWKYRLGCMTMMMMGEWETTVQASMSQKILKTPTYINVHPLPTLPREGLVFPLPRIDWCRVSKPSGVTCKGNGHLFIYLFGAGKVTGARRSAGTQVTLHSG